MALNSGVYDSTSAPFKLIEVAQHVGVATAVYNFTAPIRCKFFELQSCALAADSTDKFTASVTHVTVSETIVTGSVVAAAATPVRVTSVDSGKSAIFEPGHQYTLTMTYAGTAANVTRPYAALWVTAANHVLS